MQKKICKITDFNFSSILENLNEDNIGSNGDSADNFKAPETIHLNDDSINEEISYEGKPIDIWAFGVTLYILTFLKFPFDSDKGVLDLYQMIKKEKVNFPKDPWYSPKIKFLIKKCLEKEPKKRKTTEEILKILTVHRREFLGKYKNLFMKKKYSIDLPNDELVLSLDFIANECNAVFENPKDKNKPIIIKAIKKYLDYNIPKNRMSKEVFKKTFNKSKTKLLKGPKVLIKVEKQYLNYEIPEEKNSNKENNFIYESVEKKNNNEKEGEKTGGNFLSIVSKKVNEMTVKDDDKDDNIRGKMETTIITKTIEYEEKIVEGKTALKKYIDDK